MTFYHRVNKPGMKSVSLISFDMVKETTTSHEGFLQVTCLARYRYTAYLVYRTKSKRTILDRRWPWLYCHRTASLFQLQGGTDTEVNRELAL